MFYSVAGCIFCFSCYPHVVPEWLAKSSAHPGIHVPQELQLHVEKIAEAMHVAKPHRIKVFINKGLSSVSAGNTLLPGGAVIGLSRLVLLKDEIELQNSGISLNGDLVDWNSIDGNTLAKLLIPSTNQINFSIAHELAHIQHLDFLTRSTLAPLALITLYHTACILPQFLYPANPTALIPMVFAVGLLFYTQIHYAICHWQEHRADHRAALCRKSYAEGGVQMMKNRITLDRLTKYSKKNSSTGLGQAFQTHPSFHHRLEKLEELYFKHQRFEH